MHDINQVALFYAVYYYDCNYSRKKEMGVLKEVINFIIHQATTAAAAVSSRVIKLINIQL